MNIAISQDGFPQTIAELEQQLYPSTQFPVTVWLGGAQYQFSIWQGQQLPDPQLASSVGLADAKYRLAVREVT
jgi:hypothetical protein